MVLWSKGIILCKCIQSSGCEFCIYGFVYIYTNLPVNVIVRLLHPLSRDSQGQEKFLAPSADK